jgi:prevent-host-death family protein
MLTQTKTFPASEVKNRFGAIVGKVQTGEYTEVIVENHGEPVAAIVPVTELEALRAVREQEKRQKALATLRQAREEVQARIKGKLTQKEVDEIANRFSHELVEDLEKEGKVRFERTSS